MEEDRLERDFLHVLETGENHAGNPEENDVIAGDERIRGVEIFELLRLFRPAERGERPQGGAEPRVERVLILVQMCAAALRANMGLFAGHDRLAAFGAIPGRDAVAPPELAGNAPILDVFHPVIIRLRHAIGNELDAAVAHAVHSRAGQRLHLHEPLLGHARLHDGSAAVARADVVLDVLHAHEEALLLEIMYNGLARFQAAHAAVLAAVFVDAAVLVHDVDDFQIVAQAHFEVVRVMGRGDFDDAGSEIAFHIGIGDDGDLAADQRQDKCLADHRLIALVVRVNGNGRIAQHRFRTGGGQFQIAGAILERIAQVPEMAVLFLKFHLGVGDGGPAVRAPVDDALAAVNQALFIEAHKHLAHRLGAALVEREAFAVPVAGGAELLELLHNAAAELALPLPGAFQERLAADLLLREPFLAHGLHDLRLRGDGSVIGAGQPESAIPLHTAPADQDILQRLIERMTHVELAGDVRRRNHNGVRLLLRVRIGVEILPVHPELIDSVLDVAGIVRFGKFLAHVPAFLSF